ncbi:MAG: polysaccharide deacetylase family protein [Thermoproteota archaeon]|nr:polysaccharide deacetylase family protein [Thermoproteota archaeon]
MGSAMFAISSGMIVVSIVFGGLNYLVAFGQAGGGENIANGPQDVSENGDRKLAIITFDDGKKGQIRYAKHILDSYDYPATFSIICNNVSLSDHLNWHDIQQLERDGYDLTSHSMNHIDLEDIPMDIAYHEISESKKMSVG